MAENGWEQPLWLETTEEDPGVGMCRAGGGRGLRRGVRLRRRRHRDGGGHRPGRSAGAAWRSSRPAPATCWPATSTCRSTTRRSACGSASPAGPARSTSAAVEDRKFVVMAGLGFDAAIMRDAPEGLKKAVGWPAYVVSATKHLRGRGIRVTITIDDGTPLHRRVRTVVVGNVGKLQGNIPLLPDAQPDDGVLDIVVISIRNVLDWARVAGRVVRRAHVPDRRMERFTGQHVADRVQPHPAAPARRRRDREQPHDGHPDRAGCAAGAGRREAWLMSSVTRVPQTRTMVFSDTTVRRRARGAPALRAAAPGQGLVRPVPVRRRLQPLPGPRPAAGPVPDPAGHRLRRAVQHDQRRAAGAGAARGAAADHARQHRRDRPRRPWSRASTQAGTAASSRSGSASSSRWWR